MASKGGLSRYEVTFSLSTICLAILGYGLVLARNVGHFQAHLEEIPSGEKPHASLKPAK